MEIPKSKVCYCGSGPCIGPEKLLPEFVCAREYGNQPYLLERASRGARALLKKAIEKADSETSFQPEDTYITRWRDALCVALTSLDKSIDK